MRATAAGVVVELDAINTQGGPGGTADGVADAEIVLLDVRILTENDVLL